MCQLCDQVSKSELVIPLTILLMSIGAIFLFAVVGKGCNLLVVCSGKEYENLIMDCCQMEDSGHAVKREETGGNDPENGSPDADRGGN